MIKEIMIQKVTDGRIQVVVYPVIGIDMDETRTYYDPSESSLRRLERMMDEHSVRSYIRTRGLSVWIAR